MKPITSDELKLFSRYIYNISGIYLDESKAYLIETRLKHLMKETGAVSYYDLHRKAAADGSHLLDGKIIDAVSTRETMFFRDNSPFELLKSRILPELIARKSSQSSLFPPNIRVWSAGCSTGQEIYSIAILLKEYLPNPNKYNIHLLGSDISDAAVSEARKGEYCQTAVERGLPADMRMRFFSKGRKKWKIREDIRGMCTFKKHNLMAPFTGLGRFDIIFCRNVSIYFRKEERSLLFKKIADILEPEGYLMIGSSESLSGIDTEFEPVTFSNKVYYRKKYPKP